MRHGKLLAKQASMPFFEFGLELSSGNVSPIHFNYSLTAFIPKGFLPTDEIEIVRDPGDARPLGLKSSDNKIIGGSHHIAIRGDFSRNVSANQRGFVSLRQLGITS